ncbi:hypothetical protein LT493_11675 [Streptomyces tricolor]|nr:hypothetical protein [Streptomyces tricolor]
MALCDTEASAAEATRASVLDKLKGTARDDLLASLRPGPGPHEPRPHVPAGEPGRGVPVLTALRPR